MCEKAPPGHDPALSEVLAEHIWCLREGRKGEKTRSGPPNRTAPSTVRQPTMRYTDVLDRTKADAAREVAATLDLLE